MITQEKLLKTIQTTHANLSNYASCLSEENTPEEKEVLFKYGLELSYQLKELRSLYSNHYGKDPLSGIHFEVPFTTSCRPQD